MFVPLHLRKINEGYGTRPNHTIELDFSQHQGNRPLQNCANSRGLSSAGVPPMSSGIRFFTAIFSQPEKRGMRPQDPMVWMLANAVELLSSADRLRGQLQRANQAVAVPCWEPPVDMYENARGLIVLIALPGVVPERVQKMTSSAWVVTGPWVPGLQWARFCDWKYPTAGSSGKSGCLRAAIDLPICS